VELYDSYYERNVLSLLFEVLIFMTSPIPSPRWASIRIAVDTSAAADAASNLLIECGTAGVATDMGAYDEATAVIGYLPEDERLPARLRQIELALRMLPEIGFEDVAAEAQVTYVDEEDWANAWKKFFKPLRIGRHLIVTPPWETPEVRDGDKVLVIDPGMAFGTGTHPTTQLCLAAIEDYIGTEEVSRVADIGTGSGILAIAAKKLGAPYTLATDTDHLAVRIARANAEANGVVIDARAELELTEPFDMLVANILADTLIGLAEDFAQMVRPGGIYIASGIIEGRENDVRLYTEAEGFRGVETRRQGDWVALVFRRIED
jgi:ribosomal protein L11 methyltransferase